MTLINGEFELRGFRFGTLRSGYPLKPGGFVIGETQFRTEDQENPMGDGTIFGRDFVSGLTYSWDMLVVKEGEGRWQDASLALDAFRGVWLGNRRENAMGPTQIEELLLFHGQSVGRVYGRPRRYSEGREQLRKGIATVHCDFKSADDLIYSQDPESHAVSIVPASSGGLIAPLTAPLVSHGATQRQGFFTVSGKAATPVMVRFNGPVLNPWVKVLGQWTVGLNMDIAYDQSVEVDPRLGRRTVLRSDGAPVAGRLTYDTPALPDLVLKPGDYEMTFGGIDPTGTSTVTLTWYPARYSL